MEVGWFVIEVGILPTLYYLLPAADDTNLILPRKLEVVVYKFDYPFLWVLLEGTVRYKFSSFTIRNSSSSASVRCRIVEYLSFSERLWRLIIRLP